jgi:predicted small lipoprotein YifL
MTGALRCGAVGALIAATLTLTGCGQKGPLYLPEKGGAVVTAPATAPAAPPAPGQPPQPSPAPQPQSNGEPPPEATPAPPKKSDKDEDQQSPH